MKKIYLLTDYKNHFGSKWDSNPYRSGFDLDLLSNIFKNYNYFIIIIEMSDAQKLDKIEGEIFLYTSSEDIGYYYKSFIEDVILYLELRGAKVIPYFKYLRANNNKSFMELIRGEFDFKGIHTLNSYTFGTLTKLKNISSTLTYPVVLKKSSGAMSSGVYLAKNEKDLISKVKRVTKTDSVLLRIKEFLRTFKHNGYVPDTTYRKKFVIQEFVSGLSSDYKILIFGNRYYIFERPTRKNDFRASGSGNKSYIYGSDVHCPSGIFEFAQNVYHSMNVPHLSIDVAYDDEQFYLIEYQAIYFGTVGVVKSDGFYLKNEEQWKFQKEDLRLEQIYAESIIQFLETAE